MRRILGGVPGNVSLSECKVGEQRRAKARDRRQLHFLFGVKRRKSLRMLAASSVRGVRAEAGRVRVVLRRRSRRVYYTCLEETDFRLPERA